MDLTSAAIDLLHAKVRLANAERQREQERALYVESENRFVEAWGHNIEVGPIVIENQLIRPATEDWPDLKPGQRFHIETVQVLTEGPGGER